MATLGFTKDLYFITSTVIDWMDVFTRPAYKRIVVDSLKYCQANKGPFRVFINQSTNQIGDVLRDFKKFTSKAIVNAIQENERESRKEWLLDRCWFRGVNDSKIKNYKFWQDGSYIECIHSYDFYKEKLNYLHMNPVKQEIVEKPEDYVYSSARNYCGLSGLIDVVVQP